MLAPQILCGASEADRGSGNTSLRCAGRIRSLLAFVLNYVAMSIPHFVALEVGIIDTFCRLGFLAALRHWPAIAVVWMETIVYVTPELGGPMKPRASANEDARTKPFRTVVA